MDIDAESIIQFFKRLNPWKFLRRVIIVVAVIAIVSFVGYKVFEYATAPDTLQVALTTNDAIDSKAPTKTFHHTTHDQTLINQFYQHLQRLPLATSVAPDCPSITTVYHYTLTFLHDKRIVLTATLDEIGCPFISAYGIERAPDSRFWQLLTQIVGPDQVPPSPVPVVTPTATAAPK
jgi:hypothetical protein